MTQKNPKSSTDLAIAIRIVLALFACFIIIDLLQYRQYEYFTSPLRILLSEKVSIVFLVASSIGRTIYYYQKKLYDTFPWKIILVNKDGTQVDRLSRFCFSFFGALVFSVEIISAIYFSQPESVKIDWATFAVIMFVAHWSSEKMGYWLAKMMYTNKEEFPRYQEYLGAW